MKNNNCVRVKLEAGIENETKVEPIVTASAETGNFDGEWRLVTKGNSSCRYRKNTVMLFIKNNQIEGIRQGVRRKVGEVSKSGKLSMTRLSRTSGGHKVVFTGEPGERSGKGKYWVRNCRGTFVVAKQ